MIKIIQGFDVGSPLPIDGRILLSKEEMKNIDDNIMPDRYFCICEDDDPDRGLLYLYDKNAEKDEITGRFHKAVPEKTSEIENDGNGELNSEGVADKFDTIASVDSKVQDLKDYTDNEFVRVEEYTENNFVDNEEFRDSLLGYRLTQETSEGIIGTPIGSYIDFDYDTSDYAFSVVLKNFDGLEIARTETIDLPVEQLVMDVDYVKNSEGSFIVITLDNGNKTWVDVDAIIEGLVNEITFNDHVDDVYDANTDTHNTSLHVLYEQGQAWDAKYDLPAQGIPRSDLRDSEDSEGVLRSLDLADSAIQPGDSLSLLSNDAGSEGYFITESYVEDNLFNGSEGYIHAGQNIIVEDDEYGKKISAHVHKFIPGQGIHFSDATGSDYEDVTEIWADATAPDWAAIDGNNPLENEALAGVFNTKQDKLTAEGGIEIVETSEGTVIRSTPSEWGHISGDITDQTDLVSYIDNNGGKIDSISVNGIEQSIDSSKNVDISMPIIGAVPQGSGEGVNVTITIPPHQIYKQNHTLASVLYLHSVVGSDSGLGTGNIINFTINNNDKSVVCDRTISSIITLLNKEYLNAIVKDDQDNIYTACVLYQDPNLSLIRDIRFFTFKSGTLREISILRDAYGEEPTTSVGIARDYKVISSIDINDVHSSNGTLRLTAEDIPYWPDWFETSEDVSIFDVVGGCVNADDISAVAWSGSYNDLIDVPTKTSDFTNDGDGTSNFATLVDLGSVESSLNGSINTINSKISSAASSSNKLVDKQYVDNSISTSSATFKGTVQAAGDSEQAAQTALSSIIGMDANDYAFVEYTDSVGNTTYKRYKYNGSAWVYEYTLNTSSFNQDQWNAINSGITSTLVGTIPSTASSSNKLVTASGISASGTTPISASVERTGSNGSVSIKVSHQSSGAVAGTYGSTGTSLIPGSSVEVPSVTVNTYGHVTGISNKSVTGMSLENGGGLHYNTSGNVGLGINFIGNLKITGGEAGSEGEGWTAVGSEGFGYYQTVESDTTLANITSVSHLILGVDTSTATSAEEYEEMSSNWGLVYRAVTGYHSITFFATDAPEQDIYVNALG